MKNKVLWGLALVLLVQAVLVGMAFTPVPHNGGDNAGYIALAHSLLEQGSYTDIWDPAQPPHTKYPPVFPLLLAGVMALGVKSWAGLKMVPVMSTLLAGGFAYLWAGERRGPGMGVAVALLLALSNGVLYYSHWILSDPTFLALTFGALWALARWEGGEAKEGDESLSGAPGRSYDLRLALGLVLVLLAYFTRSAGLPLVVAVAGWMAWKRRWKALAGFLAVFSVPAGLWWLRGRGPDGGEYVSEFWLLDPYQPELGRAGPVDLIVRVWENLRLYVTEIVPGGIVGMEGPLLPLLGGVLFFLALVGWIRRLREGGGVAELFFPLYGGLILLWPQVWSGDRFALPLFPLLFFYAGETVLWLLRGTETPLRTSVVGGLTLALVVPATLAWSQEVRRARACGAVIQGGDPYGCYAANIQEYVVLARWTGLNLPEEAPVVTRKPRIFFLHSGLPARSIPFTTDPDAFLEEARSGGARYVILDRWDNVAPYYVLPVLRDRPGSFCYITGLGPEGELGTELLGLRDPGPEGPEGESVEEALDDCPATYLRARPLEGPSGRSGDVPLLRREGSGS